MHCTRTHLHAFARPRTHTHTHAYTHTHTLPHTHACTHTHTPSHPPSLPRITPNTAVATPHSLAHPSPPLHRLSPPPGLPLDPSLAVTLLAAAQHGCLPDAIVVAAMLSAEINLPSPDSARNSRAAGGRAVQLPDGDGFGDHIRLLQLFREWEGDGFKPAWCKQRDIQVSVGWGGEVGERQCRDGVTGGTAGAWDTLLCWLDVTACSGSRLGGDESGANVMKPEEVHRGRGEEHQVSSRTLCHRLILVCPGL